MNSSVNRKKIKKLGKSSFWLNNPNVLIDQREIMDLWPTQNMSFNEKLNAVSRLVILLCLVGFILTRELKIFVSGLVTLGVLVFLYYVKRDDKEGFISAYNYGDPRNPLINQLQPNDFENKKDFIFNNDNFYKLTSKNPLGNVLLPEIGDTPDRKPAPPTFDNTVENVVNKETMQMSQDLHPSISQLDKRLFQDLGDKFEFENSMIQFNTMPSTTIPNAQGAFAEFCYGNMESCKDPRTPGACGNDPPRVGSVLG